MEKGLSLITKDRSSVFLFGFLFSVFVSSFFRVSAGFAGFVFLIAAAVFVYSFQVFSKDGLQKNIISLSVFLIAVSFGMFRYGAKEFHIVSPALVEQKDCSVTLEATIVSEPINAGSHRQYVGELKNFNNEKILIRADVYPEFFYGDTVLFTGTLKEPELFETKNGKNFDYPAFLAKDDIFLTLSFAKGEKISEGNGSFLKENLFAFKHSFIEKIEKNIPEPESGLLAGILLGSEDSMPKEWEDKFRTAGISHIVVLSGYNITLVAEAVLWVLSFLALRWALLGSSLGIILFTIAVGGGASVVRASCMALLVLFARATGRKYLIGRALLFVGAIMVLVNPKVLVFDFGFQLSFLATVALIWVAPFFEDRLTWCPKKWKVREILGATLATQLIVLPLLLYTTGELSVVSVIVNLLVLPVVPVAMFFGFITALLGFLASWVAFPFAAVTQFILAYILKIVDLFSQFKFATIRLELFSKFFLILAYGALGSIFWRMREKHKEPRARF